MVVDCETIDSFISSINEYTVSYEIEGFNITLSLKENEKSVVILEKGIGLRNFDVSMIIERGDRSINIDFEINLDA